MVSGTRCPAWSYYLKKWSESRAAAPKGRCPVGHRGEFHMSWYGILDASVAIFHDFQWKFCIFSISRQFTISFNGNFTFSHFSKIFCVFNGKQVFCQFPMLFNGNLKLEKLWGGGERTDRRMYVRTDKCTYGRTYGNSPLCPTGHRPFGAAAQKSRDFYWICDDVISGIFPVEPDAGFRGRETEKDRSRANIDLTRAPQSGCKSWWSQKIIR